MEKMEILYYFLVLAILSVVISRGEFKIKYALLWVGVLVISGIGYGFRGELVHLKNQMLSTILPGYQLEHGNGSIEIKRASDGHFYLIASVNSNPVKFLIDTGATQTVITPETARYLNINLSSLVFNKTAQTSNGVIKGASLILDSFKVGTLELNNYLVSVNAADMDFSLLGMSFLNQIEYYRISKDSLVMDW